MGGFNFFFQTTDAILLFAQEFFPLGTPPFLPHKGIQDKYLNQVDHKQKGPEGYRPKVPVIFSSIVEGLIEDYKEERTYQKKDKMPIQLFFWLMRCCAYSSCWCCS